MVVILTVVSAVATGCRPDSPTSVPQADGFIALVGAGEADPLWPILRGAAAEFRRAHPKIRVRVETPRMASPNQQAALVRRLQADQMRGICLQVIDPAATAALLEEIRGDGLAVVTMMRRVDSADAFLHCGIAQRDLGAALADAVAEQVPDRGTLGLITAANPPGLRPRLAGFRQRLKRYPWLEVLREADCAGDPGTAVRLIRETGARFPGIDGWVTLEAWPVGPADDGRPLMPEGCALVLPGPIPDFDKLLTSGRCAAVVMADYHQIVTTALQACMLSAQQEIVHRRVYEAPLTTVTVQTLPRFRSRWAAWTGTPDKGTP